MSHPLQSMRTPLGKVRGLGSAKSGTGAFWHERLTGLALVPLTIAFVWIVISTLGKDYNTVRSMVARPVVAVPLLLFILNSVYHMQLGMQVIVEDYVHTESIKLAALIANIFFAVLIGLACSYAVLKIGFA